MKATPSPTARWRIEDVLDFEFLLAADADRDEAEFVARDREIPPAAAPRTRLHRWLEARREERRRAATPLPGEIFREAFHLAAGLLLGAGLLFGASLAASHLGYYGERPINALVFLALTVLPQILLLVALVLGWLSRRQWRALPGFAPVRWLARSLLLRLVAAREKALDPLDGRARLDLHALWGTMRARHSIYGAIWAWPVITLAQLFAIGFNLGVLATTLLLVTVSNRAFGWETTLQVAPETMHRFVEILAAPWSGFLPHAHPTLDQIRQSRVSLHGAGDYSTAALASWWPFLCDAVLVYGLLPRLALWLIAAWRQRRALAALPFDHADCRQLLRRMEPLVIAGNAGPPVPSNADSPAASAAPGHCIVIAADDSTEPDAALETRLRVRRWSPLAIHRAAIDDADANTPLYAALDALPGGDRAQILVVIDPDRPPIKGILLFLRRLRLTRGGHVTVTAFLPARATADFAAIWRRKVSALHDPHLAVESAPVHE